MGTLSDGCPSICRTLELVKFLFFLFTASLEIGKKNYGD